MPFLVTPLIPCQSPRKQMTKQEKHLHDDEELFRPIQPSKVIDDFIVILRHSVIWVELDGGQH